MPLLYYAIMVRMIDVLERLAEGDRRTTGAADAVAAEIRDDPALFDAVFAGLRHHDPGLRMRAADALEKASAENPSLLQRHKRALLGDIGAIEQQEVQWHVAQMLPRCELTASEKELAMDLMRHYFDTATSNIVRVMALQAIYDIGSLDIRFHTTITAYIGRALQSTAPSLRSRARRLAIQG
jgi:hypothetical protein